MKIYTDAMKEVISKRINSYLGMSGHTIKTATKYTNSDGGKWLVIHFTDDYWMMFEPIRYFDNEVNFHIIDADHFHNYEMYILLQLDIISEEIYNVEDELMMKDYHANIFNTEANNILKWMPNHPEIFSAVSQLIGDSGCK